MNTCKLTDMCCIQYGYAFDSASFTEDATFPPLVRIRDVKRGFSETYYSGNYAEEYIVRRGDILIGMDGEFNIARWQSEDALLNQRVCKIIPKQQVDASYILFALTKILKKIEDRTAFVTVKHLSAKELNKIELRLPNYKKQVLISSTLEKALRIINHRRTQLAKLDELIKCRFVELFGDQKMNPYGWPQTTVGNCCILKSGTSLPADKENEGGTIPYVKVSDMNYPGNEHYITTSSRFVTEQTAGVGVFPVGTVIFPKRGGAIGTNKKRLTKLPICADLNVMGVIAGSNLASQYLMAYFDMIDLGALDNGSSVPQINNKDIAPLPICTPPIELQEQFAAFVEKADKFKFACFFFQLITVLQKISIFFRNFLICFLF